MRFTDKVCLVTGSGSGIGRATAIRFALEGGKVVVIDRDTDGGNETVSMIKNNKGEAIFSLCDVGNEDQIKASVQLAIDTWKRIDVMVNNAAMMTFKKITDITTEEWDKVMAVNLRSVFLFCKYYYSIFKQRCYCKY